MLFLYCLELLAIYVLPTIYIIVYFYSYIGFSFVLNIFILWLVELLSFVYRLLLFTIKYA